MRVGRYGMKRLGSREVAATEEGLASLNGLLFYPADPSQRFLVSPALLYIFASEAEGRTFTELFRFTADVCPDPRARFYHCVRAKRDTAEEGATRQRTERSPMEEEERVGSSDEDEGKDEDEDEDKDEEHEEIEQREIEQQQQQQQQQQKKKSRFGSKDDASWRRGGCRSGANGRGQIYFEGAVALLQRIRFMDDDEIEALYAGRVALDDLSTAARLLSRRRRRRQRRQRNASQWRRKRSEDRSEDRRRQRAQAGDQREQGTLPAVLVAPLTGKNDSDGGDDDGEDSEESNDDDNLPLADSEVMRGCDVRRAPEALPFFVARDKTSYRNQLVAIGVLNGIIGEDRQAVQSPHPGADSQAEDPSISQACLYKKYFGMPTGAS